MRSTVKILNWVGPLIVIIVAVLVMAACASRPQIDARPLVDCPQPAAGALSPPVPLPDVSSLPGADPSAVVGALSEALILDGKVYDGEVDKRETLIDHGVRLCGWTR